MMMFDVPVAQHGVSVSSLTPSISEEPIARLPVLHSPDSLDDLTSDDHSCSRKRSVGPVRWLQLVKFPFFCRLAASQRHY